LAQVTRAQKLRLGVFVGAGLTVLVGGLAVLAGLKLGERRDRYRVRYQEAAVSLSGLEVGAPVKYSGIRVGRVDAVRIDPGDVSVVIVELSLDHGTPVAEDEKADLGSQGITGLKYVELTRGSAKARVRAPGEDIPPGQSAFDALTAQAGDIARKVDVVLDRVANLTGEDMKERVGKVLDRSEQLLATVNSLLEENRAGLKQAVARLSATAAEADELAAQLAVAARRASVLLDETTERIRSTRATPDKLNAVLDQAQGALAESRTLLGSLNSVIAQSRRDILETIGLLHDTAENVNTLSEKLKDDPTLFIRHEDEDETP
jgi:phospholipid/cholesterol/gamma-HCH transport system substrate-binding protein